MNRTKTSRILAACALAGLAWSAATSAAEVAVLRGGTRIELRSPLIRQGNTVLLTRADGTLLSLPASELDLAATAAANARPSPRSSAKAVGVSETPAGAARAVREAPKARVRVTDADVGHPLRAIGSAAPEEKKDSSVSGAGRVEIADYDQQRADADVLVRGNLRNPGATPATGVRLNVSAVDDKGQVIVSAPAVVASAILEPGRTSAFSARLAVGQTPVSVLRFSPQWISTPLAPAGSAAPGAAGTPAAPGAEPSAARPAAQPTALPYGQGLFYAAPPPSAPSVAPADGKTGYIPGAASPENQPKPPQ
ncbi:MAG TPA: hypothetical protein VOA00_07645 [Thermoanaerobaculia bacterium]|nr:hypothetical protein [Thermoanaerobaculia bacterium]